LLNGCATPGGRSPGPAAAVTIRCSYTAWLRLISTAVGGNSFSKPLQNTCPQNQPSLSSTSRLAYEIIHRSESGSGCSNSLCSLEHRRHRARAERTRNRRAEPDEPPSMGQRVRARRYEREPTSRPILNEEAAADVSPAFLGRATVEAGVSACIPQGVVAARIPIAAETAATTLKSSRWRRRRPRRACSSELVPWRI
jgi:hypothetical protein